MDELQPQRPRRHADRAVRVPDREPALPRNQIPERNRPQVPLAARRAAPAGVVGARASSRSPTSAGRSQTHHAARRTSRCAPARCRSAPSSASTCCRSRRASYFKRMLADPPQQLVDYYRQLYASYRADAADASDAAALRDGAAREPQRRAGVDLLGDRRRLALDRAAAARGRRHAATRRSTRRAARSPDRTLSLGIVPILDRPGRALLAARPLPRRTTRASSTTSCRSVPPTGSLCPTRTRPRRRSTATLDADVDRQRARPSPGSSQLTLPDESELGAVEEPRPARGRRRRLPAGARRHEPRRARHHLAADPGGERRAGEAPVGRHQRRDGHASARTSPTRSLPDGTGEPDQVGRARAHAGPPGLGARCGDRRRPDRASGRGSTICCTAGPGGAGARPPRCRRARRSRRRATPSVFVVDPESGESASATALRGARPPLERDRCAPTTTTASARAGNVGAGRDHDRARRCRPASRSTNPVRTWGGADAETVAEGEKQIARYLQHRDRLVTADDFEAIAGARPGVEIGRVDVLPAFNPELAPSAPGDAPGAVTLMVDPARRSAAARTRRSPTSCSSTRSATTSIRAGSSRPRSSCAGPTTSRSGSRSASTAVAGHERRRGARGGDGGAARVPRAARRRETGPTRTRCRRDSPHAARPAGRC